MRVITSCSRACRLSGLGARSFLVVVFSALQLLNTRTFRNTLHGLFMGRLNSYCLVISSCYFHSQHKWNHHHLPALRSERWPVPGYITPASAPGVSHSSNGMKQPRAPISSRMRPHSAISRKSSTSFTSVSHLASDYSRG